MYVRVSTSDRAQSVENQLQPLQEAARRLGWAVAAIYRDEGISGTNGRDKRPRLDAMSNNSRGYAPITFVSAIMYSTTVSIHSPIMTSTRPCWLVQSIA